MFGKELVVGDSHDQEQQDIHTILTQDEAEQLLKIEQELEIMDKEMQMQNNNKHEGMFPTIPKAEGKRNETSKKEKGYQLPRLVNASGAEVIDKRSINKVNPFQHFVSNEQEEHEVEPEHQQKNKQKQKQKEEQKQQQKKEEEEQPNKQEKEEEHISARIQQEKQQKLLQIERKHENIKQQNFQESSNLNQTTKQYTSRNQTQLSKVEALPKTQSQQPVQPLQSIEPIIEPIREPISSQLLVEVKAEPQPQTYFSIDPETKSPTILVSDTEHRQAFQSAPYYSNKKVALTGPITSTVSSCRFRIQNIKYCIGFGVAIKEIMEKHQYDYQSEGTAELMHGLYIITSQGFSWSSSEKADDDVFREGFNCMYGGLVVDVTFVNEQLSFKWKKGEFVLRVPKKIRDTHRLCYCVYLHDKADAVSLE